MQLLNYPCMDLAFGKKKTPPSTLIHPMWTSDDVNLLVFMIGTMHTLVYEAFILVASPHAPFCNHIKTLIDISLLMLNYYLLPTSIPSYSSYFHVKLLIHVNFIILIIPF